MKQDKKYSFKSLPIRCNWWCGFSAEVEAFIKTYRIEQRHVCIIKPRVNRLAGGYERLYIHLPKLSAHDLTDDLVEALFANQAGHLDITLRHYLWTLRYGSYRQCDRSRLGLQKQLHLARYRFLNHPTHPDLILARYIELEALRRYPLCWELRKALQDTFQLLN